MLDKSSSQTSSFVFLEVSLSSFLIPSPFSLVLTLYVLGSLLSIDSSVQSVTIDNLRISELYLSSALVQLDCSKFSLSNVMIDTILVFQGLSDYKIFDVVSSTANFSNISFNHTDSSDQESFLELTFLSVESTAYQSGHFSFTNISFSKYSSSLLNLSNLSVTQSTSASLIERRDV